MLFWEARIFPKNVGVANVECHVAGFQPDHVCHMLGQETRHCNVLWQTLGHITGTHENAHIQHANIDLVELIENDARRLIVACRIQQDGTTFAFSTGELGLEMVKPPFVAIWSALAKALNPPASCGTGMFCHPAVGCTFEKPLEIYNCSFCVSSGRELKAPGTDRENHISLVDCVSARPSVELYLLLEIAEHLVDVGHEIYLRGSRSAGTNSWSETLLTPITNLVEKRVPGCGTT